MADVTDIHSTIKEEGRSKKAKTKKRVEEKSDKVDKAATKKPRKKTAATALSLLADEKAINPALSTLFEAKPAPAIARTEHPPAKQTQAEEDSEDAGDDVVLDEHDISGSAPVNDADLPNDADLEDPDEAPVVDILNETNNGDLKRKRKRKDAEVEVEDVYMQRLARDEERDAARAAEERASKRQKAGAVAGGGARGGDDDVEDEDEGEAMDSVVLEDGEEVTIEDDDDDENENDTENEASTPPPKHETLEALDIEQSKANRTVFLGNVSTTAISSKAARKTLTNHLISFFPSLNAPRENDPKHKLESIRFRSTAYAAALPKKAAFATKSLMDATTKSTNAYAVYSTPLLSREAARRLNGTIILSRHLRVDEIAHPAKVDHKRCVFVGNLGFVDDESNILAANEADGREVRKRGKEPADVEEGLWRTFGKCGKVESVRVIRDSKTRVGKGIAYVQFEDENAVEQAMLLDEKKFPPMLPRKLRVARAKAQKRNAKPGSGRPSSASVKPRGPPTGYQRKISGEEASKIGRMGKLYGRAAAANVTKDSRDGGLGAGIRKPESFVFEGHRASSRGGKSGLKLGGKSKGKSGKPTDRSAKRGAAFKKGGMVKARAKAKQ